MSNNNVKQNNQTIPIPKPHSEINLKLSGPRNTSENRSYKTNDNNFSNQNITNLTDNPVKINQ